MTAYDRNNIFAKILCGVEEGFRLAAHTGPGGGQIVFHFHVHVMSGPRP
jgi:diadenosine tetraphosphate (Ap4A) HIT family hydrolase